MSIIKLVKDSVFLLIPTGCGGVFPTKIISAETCLDKSRDWEKVIGTGRVHSNQFQLRCILKAIVHYLQRSCSFIVKDVVLLYPKVSADRIVHLSMSADRL